MSRRPGGPASAGWAVRSWRFSRNAARYLISVPCSVQCDELRAVPGVIGDHREAQSCPGARGLECHAERATCSGAKVAGHVLETMWNSVVNELMELTVIARFPTFSMVMV